MIVRIQNPSFSGKKNTSTSKGIIQYLEHEDDECHKKATTTSLPICGGRKRTVSL
jgi:hypothetical protein